MTLRSRTCASLMFSPTVLPDTVSSFKFSKPLSSLKTAGTPPASSKSSRAKLPLGIMLHKWGTFLPIASKVDSGRVKPASLAIAGRCNVVLVEPPSAMSSAMAFSNASLVKICDGLRSSLTSFMICLPVALANRSLNALFARDVAQYGSDNPRASVMHDIVLAVNIPLHEPHPGHAFSSISYSSPWVIFPAATCPSASGIAE